MVYWNPLHCANKDDDDLADKDWCHSGADEGRHYCADEGCHYREIQ
mgnify:CR=1 FL=1